MASNVFRRVKGALRQSSALRIAYRKFKRLVRKADYEELAAHGIETVSLVTRTLNSNGYSCYAWCGTLLGIVREGGIIGHDPDIDLGVTVDKSFSWIGVESALSPLGFRKSSEFVLEGVVTEQQYTNGSISFDLFGVFPVADNEVEMFFYEQYPDERYSSPNEFSTKHFTMPSPVSIQSVVVKGESVFIPGNAEALLERQYGPNWRVPDPGWVSGGNWAKQERRAWRRMIGD